MKADFLSSEPIQIGCLNMRIAVRTDRVRPLVVREQKDDIGRLDRKA